MTTAATEVPDELTTDFNVYDPALTQPGEDKIQERVAELREQGPVLYSTALGGHWIVTRYDAVREVVGDPETFSSNPNFILHEGDERFLPLESDPPDHNAYRGVLAPMFSPKRMMALEEEIRGHVTDLIDGFIEDGECEFVSDFSHELPARVFLSQMGLPLEDAPKFSEWTQKMLTGDPEGTEEESQAVRAQVTEEIYGYFKRVIDKHKGEELDENSRVVSVVINTPAKFEDEERHLTEEELLQTFFLVMIGGLHTTQGALAWGIQYLSKFPEERQKLIDDPAKLNDAVEEILRLEAPVFPGRRVTRDTELAGVQLKEGDMLLMALCSANRDPEMFEEPDRVSFDRKPNKHMAFSGGRHRCIGAHLARQELRIAFEEIHKRMPDYEIAGTPVFHGSQTRGVLAMPIKFTPGKKSTDT